MTCKCKCVFELPVCEHREDHMSRMQQERDQDTIGRMLPPKLSDNYGTIEWELYD